MVAIIVILTIVIFLVVDLVARLVMQRVGQARTAKERAEALDIGLRLDLTEEAHSLKRVVVDKPKARILAVDDEEIVLDSFRKILVLAGYAVDTVESGKEALGLVQRHNYDFVFTDLKMPEMDGIEVTKAVKHLRPDIDVIVITGYATIESAVETMKYGAMDYVEKPFTEDELAEFVGKSLIRREDRIERQVKPKVHLVTPSVGEASSEREFNVPAGVFIAPSHTWASIDLNGMIRLGVDDFARKIMGRIDHLELPKKGQTVRRGEPFVSLAQGARQASLPSPVSGKVTAVNTRLVGRIQLIELKPYELGWMCCVEPTDLSSDLRSLRIGAEALSWYQEEIERFTEMVKAIEQEREESGEPVSGKSGLASGRLDDETWAAFTESFLQA